MRVGMWKYNRKGVSLLYRLRSALPDQHRKVDRKAVALVVRHRRDF